MGYTTSFPSLVAPEKRIVRLKFTTFKKMKMQLKLHSNSFQNQLVWYAFSCILT